MKLTIKQFKDLTHTEVYEILRCRSEVFVVEQNCIYQDIDEKDYVSTHVYYESDGKILAYLRVISPASSNSPSVIGRVLTMKDFRNRGLGRRIMSEAIVIAKQKSRKVEIEAQSYLLDFYRSLGFKENSDEYLLDGIKHVKMIID